MASITRRYSARERRALNMIWNAAGEYGFDAPFMAFDPDGRADFYFNNIIGLTHKWLDMEEIDRFFATYATSARADSFDDLLWLGIENALYEKEVRERPMLTYMRRDYAVKFFKNNQNLSRQQMMLTNILVFDQQMARWETIAKGREAKMSARVRELYGALKLSGDLDTNGIIEALKDILVRYCHFKDFRLQSKHKGEIDPNGWQAFLARLLFRQEHKQVDSLVIRYGTGEARQHKQRDSFKHSFSAARSEEDMDYVMSVFGRSMFSENDVKTIENELCKDAHEMCRLFFTKGQPLSKPIEHKEAQMVAKQEKEQHGKNLEFLNRSQVLVNASIRNLTAQLDTMLASFAQPLPEKSRGGKLISEKAYRMKLLKDPYVFTHPGNETENDISVDILLDASASRVKKQEIIAAQAYVLAQSLEKCHVPVQALAFRSVKGITVLQVLKDYKDHECRHIFRYWAGGWNRDGLAFRAADALIRKGDKQSKRILLILTDASPSDSTRMPPEQGSPFMREYDNYAAVADTAQAVKELRQSGVHVGAIFTGVSTHVENVRTIFGKQFVRVQQVDQLARAAGALLQMTLREMEN